MYLSSIKQSLVVLLCLCNISSGHIVRKYKRDSGVNFLPLEEYEKRYTLKPASNIIKAYITESPMITTSVETTNKNDVTCDPYILPPKRDFSAPGRRISQTKCMEYIWDLRIRHEQRLSEEKCEKEKRRIYLEEHPEEDDPLHEKYYVYGGSETQPGEFSHMGAIGWLAFEGTWIFKCGSSLISHSFVLTAAHCSSTSPRDTTVADTVPRIVRLGDKNIMDHKGGHLWPQRDINISRIIVHPKYASPNRYYDIALMELKDKVVFNFHIQPACLWQKFDVSELGEQGVVTGWGVVESNRERYSPVLLKATIDFIDTDKCNSYLARYQNRYFKGVVNHQICAGKLTGGVDPCQGDSGGPLQVKIPIPVHSQGNMHYLVGVISFGVKCGLEDTPGVYTRVSAFIDWIEPIVWANTADP